MSAPMMNAVLPPAGASSAPALAQPLSLSVPAVKTAPPSPPSIRPIVNHIAPAPISLVQDVRAKTPEKPKEVAPSPPKPTSNGTEEPLALKPPVISPPEIVASPPIAPSLPVPAVHSTIGAVAPEPASLTLAITPAAPTVALPSPASVPTPVAAAAPPSINQAAEPPREAEAPATPPPEPEPAEAAPPADSTKPKPAKPQAAKRRRETPPANSVTSGAQSGVPEKKPRRMRAPVNPYQSPLPEIITVINRSVRDNSQKSNDDKLIVFYKNEFLAVRNAEGSFYLCQTMQNIFRTSHKIRIRWLSRDEKESTESDGIYTRDFYDSTDFECILTTVALQKKDSNKYKMPGAELERVESILKRAIDVEKGVSEKPDVTEEHPDGLDLSLYRNESQLQKAKKAVKRKASTPRKSSSPKKAKKTKQKKSPAAKNVEKSSAPAKAKTPARKPPAKSTPSPSTSTEKKSSRAERSLAREKTTKSVVEKVDTKKASKSDKKPIKGKAASKKEKKKEKAEPVVEAKIEKKVDKKKKGKTGVAPSAGSSKKADKVKKTVVPTTEKRAVSTRNKSRK